MLTDTGSHLFHRNEEAVTGMKMVFVLGWKRPLFPPYTFTSVSVFLSISHKHARKLTRAVDFGSAGE